jgi:hypothetical protein
MHHQIFQAALYPGAGRLRPYHPGPHVIQSQDFHLELHHSINHRTTIQASQRRARAGTKAIIVYLLFALEGCRDDLFASPDPRYANR